MQEWSMAVAHSGAKKHPNPSTNYQTLFYPANVFLFTFPLELSHFNTQAIQQQSHCLGWLWIFRVQSWPTTSREIKLIITL
ncbi:hypothetical protein SRHO_G00281100 [Serrasalmus rhombeus]